MLYAIWNQWASVLVALLIFVCFGLSRDVRVYYVEAYWHVARAMGLKRTFEKHPQADTRVSLVFASGTGVQRQTVG